MRLPFLSLVATAFISFATSLHASTVLSENFDGLTPTLGVTSAGSFSTINGTNVDIVGAANGYGFLCASPESGNCIDMDGSGGNPEGQLQSNMLFSAGTYLLSFNLVGDGRGSNSSTTVTFGSYNRTFSLGSSDTSSGIVSNQMVTLVTPGYLLFASNDPQGDVAGNVLDNVIVSTVGATTVSPEPASLVLLGTGLLSVLGAVRKRAAR